MMLGFYVGEVSNNEHAFSKWWPSTIDLSKNAVWKA